MTEQKEIMGDAVRSIFTRGGYFGLTLFLISSLLFSSCKQQAPNERDPGQKIRIVATTGMIQDAVANIAGEHADVVALMGPGVDPHLYKATHGDLERLTSADIIFYNGLHLEGKMGEIFEKLTHQTRCRRW